MKIEVLGIYGGESLDCRLTCLLINDTIALDAGALSQALSVEGQAAVRSVILSHSHIDHTSAIPFFIDNIFGRNDRPVDIYTAPATSAAIRTNLLNDATWPDFTRLPNDLLPSVRFVDIEAETPFEIEGIRLTAIEVDHLVPTHGFLIEHEGGAILWSSDTGPTQRLWEVANATEDLQAVCIETSFDNSLQSVANDSQHLTPRTLALELKKLEKKVPIYLHHLKPACVEKIKAEVAELKNPDIGYLEQGKVYNF